MRLHAWRNNEGTEEHTATLNKMLAELNEALQDVSWDQQLSPVYGNAYAEKGKILVKLNRHVEGITAYNQALSCDIASHEKVNRMKLEAEEVVRREKQNQDEQNDISNRAQQLVNEVEEILDRYERLVKLMDNLISE